MIIDRNFKEFIQLLNKNRVNFINLEDLNKNKKASGRHQDLADLENLE